MKTLEEALAAIESLTAATEALKTAHEAEKAKILTKNAELIQREKEAKTAADEAARLKEEADEAKALSSQSLDEVKKTLEAKHQREMEKLSKQLGDLSAERDKSKVNALIEQAISKNGILEPAHDLMRAHLLSGTQVKDGVVMRGDTPLEDFIADYMASDQAKHFKAAAENSGGGSVGGGRVAAGHGFTKDNFTARQAEWLIMSKTNPEGAKQIAAEVGRLDLAKGL